MSRQLPSRPNLEFLRKQAKELLEELQRQDPSAQLADAQHALAREYGCAGWAALKARVDDRLAAFAQGVRLFAGAWKADLGRSRRHPANRFQSATIVFEVNGDDVLMSDVVVDEAGREERHINSIRLDGRLHLAIDDGRPHLAIDDGRERTADPRRGYSVRASWRDSYSFEAIGMKDGQTIGGVTYALSADGRTLTISADQQVIVLDRVSGA